MIGKVNSVRYSHCPLDIELFQKAESELSQYNIVSLVFQLMITILKAVLSLIYNTQSSVYASKSGTCSVVPV